MRFAWGRIREGARPKSGSFVADHPGGACVIWARIAVPMMNDRDWWQLDSGAHYRELATWLRDVARRCHLPNPQAELLSLARRYERRGEQLDRRARRSGAKAAAG
jgi:hypothetical protein